MKKGFLNKGRLGDKRSDKTSGSSTEEPHADSSLRHTVTPTIVSPHDENPTTRAISEAMARMDLQEQEANEKAVRKKLESMESQKEKGEYAKKVLEGIEANEKLYDHRKELINQWFRQSLNDLVSQIPRQEKEQESEDR